MGIPSQSAMFKVFLSLNLSRNFKHTIWWQQATYLAPLEQVYLIAWPLRPHCCFPSRSRLVKVLFGRWDWLWLSRWQDVCAFCSRALFINSSFYVCWGQMVFTRPGRQVQRPTPPSGSHKKGKPGLFSGGFIGWWGATLRDREVGGLCVPPLLWMTGQKFIAFFHPASAL